MLGSFNRTTVDRDSGSIVANAVVKFYYQRNGLPAPVYEDVDGLESLGSSVTSDNDGRVAVFLQPDIYRITITGPNGLLDELLYEPIINPLAASISGITFDRINHTVKNFKLFAQSTGSGLSIEFNTHNPSDLDANVRPSVSNPLIIDFIRNGGGVSKKVESLFTGLIPNAEDFGFGATWSGNIFVYAVANTTSAIEGGAADFRMGVALHTNFDEGVPQTVVNYTGSNFNNDKINLINGSLSGSLSVRLVGRIAAVRTSGTWRLPTSVIGYTGDQTHITSKARDLLFQETPDDMKDVMDFTAIGKNLTLIPNVSAVSFMRINANETITTRTADQTRTDIFAAGINTTNTFSENQTFQSDVTIQGSLFVTGSVVEVDSQLVTADTVVRFNDGETGPGVTAGFSGIEIDRGTETDYEFGFNEVTGWFEVGEVGARQAVATRETNPDNNGFAVWNSTASRFDTKTGVIARSILGVYSASETNTAIANAVAGADGSMTKSEIENTLVGVVALTPSGVESTLELKGGWGGRGRLYVGQDDSKGGGIEHSGGGSYSASSGAGTDQTALYRRTGGTNYWTARNNHSNNDWEFRANVIAYSDETLKTNWRYLSENFVKELSKVKVGIYDRTDIKATQIGVGAQSLQKVMPNAVFEGCDKKLTVAYGNAALAAAVKLAERIVELEARLEKLENK